MSLTSHAGPSPESGTISLLVVKVCAGLFLLLASLDLVGIWSWHQADYVLGISYPGFIRDHWWFQVVSAPFLHGSATHLAFNMLTVWMLGPDVELILGRRRYLVLSGLSAAASTMGFLVWNWGTGTIGFGYSGVVFGLLVAQARLFPDRVLYVYAFFPLKMKHAALLLAGTELLLLISPGRPTTAHVAHVFGAVASWLYLRVALGVESRCSVSRGATRTNVRLFGQASEPEIPREL